MKRILFLPVFFLSLCLFGQSAYDEVYLVDKTKKIGIVKSIDEFQIIFQEKDNQEKTTIRLSIIWKILYSNGYEEVFNNPLPEDLIPSENGSKEKSKGVSKQVDSSVKSKSTGSKTTFADSGLLERLADNQDWRSLVGVDFGGFFPIIFGPSSWISAKDGLALYYGFGAEVALSIDPIKYLGISISQGYMSHQSYLPASEESSSRERISLINSPTTIKLNLYPKKDIILTGGFQFSTISISQSNPEITGQSMSGYTFGLGKLIPVGANKNYLSLTANFNSLNTDSFLFKLDRDKFPDLDPLELEFNSLQTVDIKLKFHFGIIK
ncbi:hypothetical protein [Mongoliitalea lutea]|uniref:Outer membrane protein beta-barrel domain-containing protein n=1 Tax=Mongoliitalea lutea TaxID=849756 RepID=A0A8J3G4J5_9BACT|nr:hypothetical protein [Mongoliitalea lutea]GHB29426.1 hypothetical protein GCM10008106_07960 [Mongoliitalea lutea]